MLLSSSEAGEKSKGLAIGVKHRLRPSRDVEAM